jgi:hypothetical protein
MHSICSALFPCTLRRIARLLDLPLSTDGRTLKTMGLGRLKHL